MNKRIMIFLAVIAAFSLAALGYSNWNNTAADQDAAASSSSAPSDIDPTASGNNEGELDLYYNVGNRWFTRTKEELNKVESITDLLSDDHTILRDSYRNVWVAILHNDKDVRDTEISAMGQSEEFNAAQLELLRSCEYSTNFRITARNRRSDATTGVVNDNDSIIIYMTVVPEKQAEFEGGFEALIDYLKASSKDKVDIIEEDQLEPGKVFFTVTKQGTISNVKMVATCGYPSVDEELVKIVTDMPEKWTPAENPDGEKVDQEFIFSFGEMGC